MKGIFIFISQMRRTGALRDHNKAGSTLWQVEGRAMKTGPRLLSRALTAPHSLQISQESLST